MAVLISVAFSGVAFSAMWTGIALLLMHWFWPTLAVAIIGGVIAMILILVYQIDPGDPPAPVDAGAAPMDVDELRRHLGDDTFEELRKVLEDAAIDDGRPAG